MDLSRPRVGGGGRDTEPLPETAAILRLRHAVDEWLAAHAPGPVAVGLSGGADSLALTAITAHLAPETTALIVDHRLQPGSEVVAEQAAELAIELGCVAAHVLPVDVGEHGGPEAAARQARYSALDGARGHLPVLLAHTLDDQAETVLLGLGRGSGARSISAMRAWDPPWGRPLLVVPRVTTRQACADLGLDPHEDPHNASSRFTRVRLRREVLPLLEDVLGGGVAAALARTAEQLRDDDDALDTIAVEALRGALDGDGLSVQRLAGQPPAIRRRALRAWLMSANVGSPTSKHLTAIDELLVGWRGQGAVAVPGGRPEVRLVVERRHGRLTLGFDDGRVR